MWWKKLEITRARMVKVETAASWDGDVCQLYSCDEREAMEDEMS